MGWIQVVTVKETGSDTIWAEPDLLPMCWGLDNPFFAFGHAPTFFDAPGPNPPRIDETWTVDTFLAVCPDIGRNREVAALLGFRWGYALKAARPTPLPLTQGDSHYWDSACGFLRERFASWEFKPGFAKDL